MVKKYIITPQKPPGYYPILLSTATPEHYPKRLLAELHATHGLGPSLSLLLLLQKFLLSRGITPAYRLTRLVQHVFPARETKAFFWGGGAKTKTSSGFYIELIAYKQH